MHSKEKWFREKSEKTILPVLKKWKLPAEALTISRIIFAIITAIVLLNGNWVYSAIFITIYQFFIILDYLDGKLARYQKRFSIKWVYVDRISHHVITFLFIFCLAISTKNTTIVLISSIPVLLFSLIGIFETPNFIRNIKTKEKSRGFIEEIWGFFILESPFSLFYFGVILNLKEAIIILYSIFYAIGLIYKVLHRIKN